MKRGPPCRVCEHPQRAQIELSLANGVPCRQVAKRFDVHRDSAYRHGRNHMSAELKTRLKVSGLDQPVDLERLRITESEGLLQHLVAVRGRLYRALDKAEEIGIPGDVARVATPLHKNLELTGKLLGDLKTGGTVNNVLILSPQYHELRTGLVQALKPFPGAREAVVNLLQRLEHTEQPESLQSAPMAILERPALEYSA